MSGLPRYLVAKYISDLQRMEPKNIGVIVWMPGSVSARFLAEKPGSPGEIDGRSVPTFVTSTAAYKQWVDFWRSELMGKVIPRRQSQNWFDSLKQTSSGNFCLVDGGFILDAIEDAHLRQVTNDLYFRLVEPGPADEVRDPALDQVTDDLIKRLRLRENTEFHSRFEVRCEIAPNIFERFEFSHAYKNGSLKRLYQRVPLARKRTPLRRAVHDSAWMFDKVTRQGIISRNEAIALVYATEEHKRDPEVSWSFDVLNSVARVANLADSTEAVAAFVVS
jgi:peptidyl-tRNA hydrolase